MNTNFILIRLLDIIENGSDEQFLSAVKILISSGVNLGKGLQLGQESDKGDAETPTVKMF